MTEAKPEYRSLLRRLVSGFLVWCTFSSGLRCSRPLTCKFLSGQGIGEYFVVYRPILERGGIEVCIYTTVIVAGLVAEMDNNEFSPSLRRSSGGTCASVRSVPLWGPLIDLTGNYGLGVSLVLEILTSMRPVAETLEKFSC